MDSSAIWEKNSICIPSLLGNILIDAYIRESSCSEKLLISERTQPNRTTKISEHERERTLKIRLIDTSLKAITCTMHDFVSLSSVKIFVYVFFEFSILLFFFFAISFKKVHVQIIYSFAVDCRTYRGITWHRAHMQCAVCHVHSVWTDSEQNINFYWVERLLMLNAICIIRLLQINCVGCAFWVHSFRNCQIFFFFFKKNYVAYFGSIIVQKNERNNVFSLSFSLFHVEQFHWELKWRPKTFLICSFRICDWCQILRFEIDSFDQFANNPYLGLSNIRCLGMWWWCVRELTGHHLHCIYFIISNFHIFQWSNTQIQWALHSAMRTTNN